MGEWEDAITQYSKAITTESTAIGESGATKEYLALYYNNRGLAHYHF